MGSESSRQATSPWQAATRRPRSNATHESSTDPRLYKTGGFPAAQLRYITHTLSENRHGLIVAVETTQATGNAEVEAATAMIARSVPAGGTVAAEAPPDQADIRLGGTDKGNFRGVFHPPDSGWFGRRCSRLQAGRAARPDRLNSVAGHQCTGNATFLNSSSHSCWSRMCIARSTTSRVRCGANIWMKS